MSDSNLKPEHILEITNSLAQGNKIAAIKIYRVASGLGLKESIQFVDQVIPGLIEQDPDRFAALSGSGAGCLTVILFAATLLLEVFVGCLML